MFQMKTDLSLRIGTVAGTLLSAAPHVASSDILRTVILAAIGAVVSYFVSYILRMFQRRSSRKCN